MGVGFGLLGEVDVRVDGHLVDVGHARQRCVLGVLLVDANRAVPVDQLVDRVWGDRAPHRARETLYNYLSRLRHALDPISEVHLARRTGGYVLTVDPMAVDLHRFHHLVTQARAVADEDQALVLFEQALGLWRGEPFAGLDTPWVNALRGPLERDRFAVELDRTDLQLRRGRPGWLLGAIATRAGAHPLDERVADQLMLTLYQCGRQAEALDHFHQLRMRLAEELGIDPSPDLQRRYEQILTADPTLAAPSATTPASASSPPPVPRQLPAHTPHFVGRVAELRQLTALLDKTNTNASGGATVVITAIDGTAGIGKTALALHWAHQTADRFPDGQLYVNLRGFDPNTPISPVDALRGFLDAFAIPSAQIPAGLEAQAGLYRSLLTDRRVLIVLDNARDTEQIRPLLPAGPTCLVLITSRNQLAGLIAHHGVRPVTLDLLTTHEARALLTRHLGPDRVRAEPDALTDLIDHCSRLPLALAIVAARATTHPGFALWVLAKELADEHTRLDALDSGDPTTNVRTVFSWSYQHLSTPAARMFRLLGLHPGPDIALPAATQLADIPLNQARESLSELTRAHLLTEQTLGRFAFHDLLRAYATHLATTCDPQHDHHTALTRLFDHYLHTTAAAMDTVYPTNQQHWPPNPQPATPTAPMSDARAARAWLDAERANLTAIIAHTAAHGWHTHTTRLANTVLLRYLEIGVQYHDSLTIYTHVRHAARHTHDQATEALALANLGVVHWRHGHYQQATDNHQQAISICREIGFPFAEALALTNLGIVHWQQGRYQQAADHHQQALAISREIGDRSGEAYALGGVGIVHWRQGRHQQAAAHLQQAIAISREIGFRVTEALALTYLGLADWKQGQYQLATGHHQQAIAISREISFPFGEALGLTNLGLTGCMQGSYQVAADHHQQALTLCQEIGDRVSEAQILNGLGETRHANGELDQAHTRHATALTLATEIGDRYEQARAHHGLAHTHYATGDLDQARHHWQQALAIYTDIDVPDADDVRTHLTGLDQVRGCKERSQTGLSRQALSPGRTPAARVSPEGQ